MREFTKVISTALIAGLRNDERSLRNRDFLEEAFNVVAREEGLDYLNTISDPFEGNETVSFPFPQLYRGQGETLLLEATSISSVDESGTPWTSTPLTTDNPIVSGGVWHVADFKESWYLFNKECIVAKIDKSFEGADYFVNSTVKVNTGTAFRGRVVIGGVNPNTIWPDEWSDVFAFWKENNQHLPDWVRSDPDRSYVMWGSIGGGDFPLWLFKPELIMSGSIPEPDSFEDGIPTSYVIEILKRNEFGFMPMPYQGEVLVVKELGNGIMAYGEDGIVYLPHVSGGDGLAPTFGLTNIMGVGIAGRGAVGGTKDAHIFIDDGGSLWTINSQLEINKLGYKEQFFDFLGSDIVITYDAENSEFYIASDSASYILSRGLTQTHQHPTSLDHTGGGLVGLFSNTLDGAVIDESVRIVSNPFDMNIRGTKTIVAVGLAVEAISDVRVAIDYRYNANDAFQRTHYQVINKEGNAMIRTHGLEFRLVVECDDYEGFALDFAHIKWQGDDKRFTRGLAPTDAEEA